MTDRKKRTDAHRDPNGAKDQLFYPAYRYGWESYWRYAGRKFEDVEAELSRSWDKARGKSSLGWEHARSAVRDVWRRVERALPGDADGDGR